MVYELLHDIHSLRLKKKKKKKKRHIVLEYNVDLYCEPFMYYVTFVCFLGRKKLSSNKKSSSKMHHVCFQPKPMKMFLTAKSKPHPYTNGKV